MERLSPPKPRRNEDALCETAGSAPHGAGLRPPGRGVPDPCRRPERLHRTRHTRNSSRGMTPSGERGTLTVSQFVQQSQPDPPNAGTEHLELCWVSNVIVVFIGNVPEIEATS